VTGAKPRRIGAVAILLAAVVTWGLAGQARAAAPYTLRTEAVYRLDPAGGAAAVSVSVVLTNTTPDSPGGFSSFGSVPLSLEAGASVVAARDRAGSLRVTLARQASRTIATVALRSALRYRQSVAFTLAYRLADAANPQVRMRSSALMIPLWGYGTASSVTVRLPAAYSARVFGAAMTTASQKAETVLSSGALRDPAHWSALLVAARPTDLVTVSRRVPLSGGTVDLWVRSFPDDRAWGTATLELAARALPALQHAVGLPYSGVGPLVITESLPLGVGPLAEPASGAQDIATAFDASPFAVLHQLAHVWMGPEFASERWIREGLASHFAAIAARQLQLPVPQRAAADATGGDPAAIPLTEWSVTSAGPKAAGREAWAYSASWALTDSLAAAIGEERLKLAVQRAADGVPAYDSAPDSNLAATAGASGPIDSRQLLDQLDEVLSAAGSGADAGGVSNRRVEAAFRAIVWPSDMAPLLDERARARASYDALVRAAGDWGPPQTVTQAMESWRFDDALTLMDAARSWLTDRDAFLATARGAGLSTPDRLMMVWRTNGGGDASRRELDGEVAFLQAYQAAGEHIDGLNPIERLGVLGGAEPQAVLASAAGLYAGGDLDAAVAAIDRAVNLDAGAQGSGVVRLAAAVAALSVIAAALLLGLRRLRRGFPSLTGS
jgi:hypothetical protein